MSQAAEKAPKAPKIEANGVVRPNAGTSTGRIWEIADDLSAKAGKPVGRAEVIDAAVAQGINKSTASTQYGRWTKFHGIVAEKKEAAPAAAPAAEPAAQ